MVKGSFIFGSQEFNAILKGNWEKYVEVVIGFQTSADNIFIIGKFPFSSPNIIKVVKGSTGEMKECIFPYYEKGGEFYSKVFSTLSKEVKEYLLQFKSELEARDTKENDK